jgi:hypothetical protein
MTQPRPRPGVPAPPATTGHLGGVVTSILQLVRPPRGAPQCLAACGRSGVSASRMGRCRYARDRWHSTGWYGHWKRCQYAPHVGWPYEPSRQGWCTRLLPILSCLSCPDRTGVIALFPRHVQTGSGNRRCHVSRTSGRQEWGWQEGAHLVQ